MKLACLSFTRFGETLAQKISQGVEDEVHCFSADTYKDQLNRIMEEFDGIVFISSTGIAVRMIAPHLTSKTTDPAVVVIDDTAKFAVSLVSGHIGGANELTRKLADLLGCQAVITTASDNRGIEAVDLFAHRHHLVIEDLNAVKQITAMMVDGKRIGFYSPCRETIDYPNLVKNHPEGCIFVDIAEKIDCSTPYCLLRPRVLHIGIGCRHGKPTDQIMAAIEEVFKAHNLSLKAVRSIATIDLKANEHGIRQACNLLDCELNVYPIEQIKSIETHFDQSDFVKEITGVGAVAEPCACLAGGKVIVPKQIIDGITIAVSQSAYP